MMKDLRMLGVSAVCIFEHGSQFQFVIINMADDRWKNQSYIKTFLAADHQELRKFSWRTLRTMHNRLIAFGLCEKFKDRYEDLLLAIEEKYDYHEPSPGIIQLIKGFFSKDEKTKPENKKEGQGSPSKKHKNIGKAMTKRIPCSQNTTRIVNDTMKTNN